MTATVGDLLRLLDRQVHALGQPTEHDTAIAHLSGWRRLASSTRQVIRLLPLGGRAGHVKTGLHTVLAPLVEGSREILPDHLPAPRLIQTSRTIGAIADILADRLHGGGRDNQIGTEATKLEASLLSAVHVIARWSRAVTAKQKFPGTAGVFPALLTDLIVVTEPYALIPPNMRGSVLEDLRLPNPGAPGLEGAVIRWAAEATLILQERHRVSGWAMQAIAGNLALLSRTAGRAAIHARDVGDITKAQAENLTGWFAESARLWRTAATWPRHLRLGGHTPTLRELGTEVRDACIGTLPRLDTLKPPMQAAARLSLLHASAMDHLAAKHQLWMHTVRTDYRGQQVEGWTREPPGTMDSWHLVHAARDAHRALDRAVHELSQTTRVAPPTTEGWPPEPTAEHATLRREPAGVHVSPSSRPEVGR